MKIAIAKEVDAAEPRVAATPDTVKKFKALGIDIIAEPGAGIKSGLLDADCEVAGAVASADAVKDADIVIKEMRPDASELSKYKKTRWSSRSWTLTAKPLCSRENDSGDTQCCHPDP